MPTQTLKPKVNEPVYIETPLGIIEIEAVKVGGTKTFQVNLPAGLVAHKGLPRAISAARWLKPTEKGYAPLYRLLVPVRDQNGNIIDVRAPETVRMPAGEVSHGRNDISDAVEDVASSRVG